MLLDHIRTADIDGSGTTHLVYADANAYKWIDFMGGIRPRLLQTIDNGLGALTTLSYGSSAEDYLRDLAESRSIPTLLDPFRVTASVAAWLAESRPRKGVATVPQVRASPVITLA